MNNLGEGKGMLGLERAGSGCMVYVIETIPYLAVIEPSPRQWLDAGRTLDCHLFLEQMKTKKADRDSSCLSASKARQKAPTSLHLCTKYIPRSIFEYSKS